MCHCRRRGRWGGEWSLKILSFHSVLFSEKVLPQPPLIYAWLSKLCPKCAVRRAEKKLFSKVFQVYVREVVAEEGKNVKMKTKRTHSTLSSCCSHDETHSVHDKRDDMVDRRGEASEKHNKLHFSVVTVALGIRLLSVCCVYVAWSCWFWAFPALFARFLSTFLRAGIFRPILVCAFSLDSLLWLAIFCGSSCACKNFILFKGFYWFSHVLVWWFAVVLQSCTNSIERYSNVNLTHACIRKAFTHSWKLLKNCSFYRFKFSRPFFSLLWMLFYVRLWSCSRSERDDGNERTCWWLEEFINFLHKVKGFRTRSRRLWGENNFSLCHRINSHTEQQQQLCQLVVVVSRVPRRKNMMKKKTANIRTVFFFFFWWINFIFHHIEQQSILISIQWWNEKCENWARASELDSEMRRFRPQHCSREIVPQHLRRESRSTELRIQISRLPTRASQREMPMKNDGNSLSKVITRRFSRKFSFRDSWDRLYYCYDVEDDEPENSHKNNRKAS